MRSALCCALSLTIDPPPLPVTLPQEGPCSTNDSSRPYSRTREETTGPSTDPGCFSRTHLDHTLEDSTSDHSLGDCHPPGRNPHQPPNPRPAPTDASQSAYAERIGKREGSAITKPGNGPGPSQNVSRNMRKGNSSRTVDGGARG